MELTVVMVLLAFLAAIAFARYADMRRDAHKAAFAGLIGQFQTGVRLANQMCIVRGWAGKDNLTGFGSGNVDFDLNCYPADTSGSNSSAANAARCMRIFLGVLNTSYTIATAATSDIRVATASSRCRFTYRRDSVTRYFDYAPGTGAVSNITNP